MFNHILTPEQKKRSKMLENRAWVHENFSMLQEKYADKWIAVLGKKIIEDDSDVEIVKRAIKDKRNEALIMRIPSGEVPTPM